MKYGMTESFTLISMLIFGAVIKSFTTRMFKSNSGEPYAGKLHVRFLEEFISNCLIIREGENLLMQISYNKLFKLLIDKGMKKTDLAKEAKLTPATLAKLSKQETVSMDTLIRICDCLDCSFDDVVELIKD